MGHQIIDNDTEEIKLKVPETSAIQTRFTRKFNNPETSEFSTNSRKLRVFLNKVTDENFQKLITELIESLSFDEKLISEFLRLIFERASSRDSSDFYLKIILFFSFILSSKSSENHEKLTLSLTSKSESTLSQSTPISLSLLRFIGSLFKENLLGSETIVNFLKTQSKLTENQETEKKEQKIEALCTMIQLVSRLLVKSDLQSVEEVFRVIESLEVSLLPRKVQFLVQETLEQKETLMTEEEHLPMFQDFPQSKTGKRVSFVITYEFQPVVSNRTKRILKHSVSDCVKENIRNVVADYVKGKKDLEPFELIFSQCKNQERQLVNQIFKYSLIQFNREQEFLIICEIICRISEKIVTKDVVETGIAYTVEAVEDIKLDTPMAQTHLEFMIKFLKEHGVVENSEYLLKHMARTIIRKYSESSLES